MCIEREDARAGEPSVPCGLLGGRLAVQLFVLYVQEDSPKCESAAVRWLARLALEGRDSRPADVQLAAGALASLRGPLREQTEKTLLPLL